MILVLGGTRSGKSAVAEGLVRGPVAYLATGAATDPEMAARIERHRARRPAEWTTHDVGEDPAAALAQVPPGQMVLLDGVGGWIAGELHRAGAFDDPSRPDAVHAKVGALLDAIAAHPSEAVVVCEEAGLAPVAASAATRRWVDLLGETAQRLSTAADRALLVVAGRVLELPTRERGLTPGPSASLHPCGPMRERGQAPFTRPDHGDRLVPPGHEDFAVNVLDEAPAAWLHDALRDVRLDKYPDDRATTAAVAARHGRAADECLLLNGAAEGFWLLAATRPRSAAIVTPGFSEPFTALRAHGLEPRRLECAEADDFTLRPWRTGAELLFVTNPCNPTGVLHPRAAIERLEAGTLVVDESFMDLVPGEPESVADHPDLVVLRSLTKSLGIPGVRAGYLLGPAPLVARLAALRQAWPLNAHALAALGAWAEQEEPTRERAERVARDRERLAAKLLELPGVHVVPGAANFLLVRVPDGPATRARLAKHRIAVRPTTDLGLSEHHLRIAVRDAAAQDRLLAAMRGA